MTGNAINHVPYHPLPTYPAEVFVNSNVVEFGLVTINGLSQTTSRPSPTSCSASIQNSPFLLIKSKLQLALNDTKIKTQEENALKIYLNTV